jgi:glycosyltransferase involved in cell wall biosynthesis
MKTVLLRGPMLTLSGYGVHARQIAKWLFRVATETHELDITTEPLPWGRCHLVIDPEAEDGLIGQIIQAAGNKKNFYDVTIQVQLPNEWNPFLGNFNIGVTAGVETDKCNPAWVECINRMDMVIVPSEFTKQMFLDTGTVTVPLVVVPEAFPESFDKGQPKALDLGLKTKFNFLVVGQLTGNNTENDRKNLPYTIKWLAETFAGCPDVGVVLKTNSGAHTQLDKRAVTGIFSKLVGEVSKPNGPTFYLLHGHMTDEEMHGLYVHPDIKALVTLTHGEGYGLPVLEAAACGLPVIATNWSGHLEFLKHGKFIAVESTVAPIPESRIDNQIFMKDVKWANPSEADAKYRLRKFYGAPQLPKQWATELAIKIKDRYSFESIARTYSLLLGEHLKKDET